MIQKEVIREILLENRKEIELQHIVPRDIQMEEFANYVLIGVRRAGKSFMLYQQIQQYLKQGISWNSMLYLNFEDERLMGMTAQELNLILEVHSMMSDKTPQQVHINGNYQTYLTTADGRKIPVQIEHTQTRKPKGMLAMMSKLFTGTPSQKALLNMLIDSRLKPAQLAEIKRAKDNHFTDEELKDLIECDLPAEEMAGIINVIISDR